MYYHRKKTTVYRKNSALRRFFNLPPILRVDFDKPVPHRQQFAIMGTVLVISCALFLCVYLFQMLYPTAEESTETPGASSTVTSEKPAEKKPESSVQESSAAPVRKVTSISSADKAILKNMTTVTKEADEVYKGALILVNKNFPSRLNGENVELVLDHITGDYAVSDYTVGFAVDMIDPFNKMMADFSEEFGETDILVSCGYRSLDTQKKLLMEEKELSGYGPEESESQAEQWVAPPGFSEHQTGLAFDFDLNLPNGGKVGINYDGEGDYAWLNKNCADYGFILRYLKDKEDITGYQYEPWHFRYVGLPHAQYIDDHHITLEEYLEMVQTHTTDNAILMKDRDGINWCIYYVPASDGDTTEIPVPQDYEYSISGNNMVDENGQGNGGFIVTVKIGDYVEEIIEPSKTESSRETSVNSSEPSVTSENAQEESSSQSSNEVTVIDIPDGESSQRVDFFDPLQGVY